MANLPPTVEIDRYEVILGMLRAQDKATAEMRADLCLHLEELDKKYVALSADLTLSTGQFKTFSDATEARLRATSDRAGKPSAHDLETAAALASEIVARESLAKEVARNSAMTERIESAVTGLISSPRMKLLAWAISTALLGWLASKGITVGK